MRFVVVSAIIPAAGSGRRMNQEIPKQFLTLGEAPVLAWTVRLLLSLPEVEEVVIGAAEQEISRAASIVAACPAARMVKIVAGGEQRQDTVRECLRHVRSDAEMVVVHDAVRPFASPDLVARTIQAAAQTGAATAAIRPADAMKMEKEDGSAAENLPRNRLWAVQTPQAFRRELLEKAHEKAAAAGFLADDDTALVERLGVRVELVPGERLNFKLTTAEDLLLARALVNSGLISFPGGGE